MKPSQKAFIDAHLDIFVACKDCSARVASFANNAYLPIKPEALAITRTGTAVICTLGLDERYREQISRTPREGVWEGLCTCRRRWRYSQANMHAHTGQLSVGLRPEPVAAPPRASTPPEPIVQPAAGPSKEAPAALAPSDSVSEPNPAEAPTAKPLAGGAPPGAPVLAAEAIGTTPPLGQLRSRVGLRLPYVDGQSVAGPYFASMYRHDQPIQDTLVYRKGSFVLLLAQTKSSHKHPEPLDRPELQMIRAHAFDEDHARGQRPALLEVPVEYFDESVLDGLCCVDLSVLVSADGCLYRPLTPTSYDAETPDAFPKAMPDSPHARRGVDAGELRSQCVEEFPWIFREPSRAAKESGVADGRCTDVLGERGLGRHPVVLAVEWSTVDYNGCSKGETHPPMMQRPGVREWIRQSVSTTGFVTRQNEPLLIAMRSAPPFLDEDLCCLSVRILVPSTGTTLHRFAPNKVRWETR